MHESPEPDAAGAAEMSDASPSESSSPRVEEGAALPGSQVAGTPPARSEVFAGAAEEAQAEKPPAPHSNSEEASLNVPRNALPPSLRGTLESLERQNTRLDAEGLERIENEADLAERIAHKLLVPVPVSDALSVNADLPENHRYCRPWTARFLSDLANAHQAAFHKPLEVSSAVRTVEYQQRLMRSNGNAAPAEGDIVSPHMTGAAVDIAKKGLTRSELLWMRQRLAALESAGKIDVEEEFRQACFHITVYKEYAPSKPLVPAQPAKPGTQSHPAPVDSTQDSVQGL